MKPQVVALVTALAALAEATAIDTLSSKNRMIRVPVQAGPILSDRLIERLDPVKARSESALWQHSSGEEPDRHAPRSQHQHNKHKHGKHGREKGRDKGATTTTSGSSGAIPDMNVVGGDATKIAPSGAGEYRKGPDDLRATPSPASVNLLASRGLLDNVIPVVGLIPGLEGIIKLVPELLSGLLGPALGGLIISPSQSSGALSTSSGAESQYVLAATTKDPSTIWLVDEGDMAPASTLTTDTPERMVSLQMAFVDPQIGVFQPYCATYEQDPTKPAVLGVMPCRQFGPNESQVFAYDSLTGVVRALWPTNRPGNPPAKSKRQFMIGQPGGKVKAEGGSGTVVMVFQAANATSANASSTHDLMAQEVDNPTAPAHNSSSEVELSGLSEPISDPFDVKLAGGASQESSRMAMGESSSMTASSPRVFDAKPTITESTTSTSSGVGGAGLLEKPGSATSSIRTAVGPTLAPIV